jgi:hypothetical protein
MDPVVIDGELIGVRNFTVGVDAHTIEGVVMATLLVPEHLVPAHMYDHCFGVLTELLDRLELERQA